MKNAVSEKRYNIIDCSELVEILGFRTLEQLQKTQQDWVEEVLEDNVFQRESKWTESIPVGNEDFVKNIRHKLYV